MEDTFETEESDWGFILFIGLVGDIVSQFEIDCCSNGSTLIKKLLMLIHGFRAGCAFYGIGSVYRKGRFAGQPVGVGVPYSEFACYHSVPIPLRAKYHEE